MSMRKETQSSFKEKRKVYSLCVIHLTTASSQGDQAVNGWNGGRQSKKCKRNGNRNKTFFHVSPIGAKLLNAFAQGGRMWSL